MAESEPKFVYATTTIISKPFAAEFKFFFSAGIFRSPTSESKLSKSIFWKSKLTASEFKFSTAIYCLNSLIQILIICPIHNKLRSRGRNVAILITQRQSIQYEKILRVVEHKILLIKIQKLSNEGQGSKAQTCKQSTVAKARHIN